MLVPLSRTAFLDDRYHVPVGEALRTALRTALLVIPFGHRAVRGARLPLGLEGAGSPGT